MTISHSWISSTDTAIGSFTITIEKNAAGAANMTAAQSVALHAYPNKKNILYTTQGLSAGSVSNPQPVVRQWIKIPKGKQRFGLGDRLTINILATATNLQFCGQFIYKSYN